jgi:hypothetical protein
MSVTSKRDSIFSRVNQLLGDSDDEDSRISAFSSAAAVSSLHRSSRLGVGAGAQADKVAARDAAAAARDAARGYSLDRAGDKNVLAHLTIAQRRQDKAAKEEAIDSAHLDTVPTVGGATRVGDASDSEEEESRTAALSKRARPAAGTPGRAAYSGGPTSSPAHARAPGAATSAGAHVGGPAVSAADLDAIRAQSEAFDAKREKNRLKKLAKRQRAKDAQQQQQQQEQGTESAAREGSAPSAT